MLWELIHSITVRVPAHHGMAPHVDWQAQTGSVLALFASSLSFCVLDRAKGQGGYTNVSVQTNSCCSLFWALIDSLNHVYSDLGLLWLPAQHWLSRVQYSTHLFPLLTIHSSLLPIFSVLSICNCSFHIFFKICYKNFPQILFLWWYHFTSSSVYFFRELCYNWYGKIYLFFSFPFLFFSLYISIWIPTPSPPLNLPPHPLIHPSERVRHIALQ